MTLFDNFNDISTFTTAHYLMCDIQYAVCYLHVKQIAISQERYGETIDGIPLSFQEFFQTRQT